LQKERFLLLPSKIFIFGSTFEQTTHPSAKNTLILRPKYHQASKRQVPPFGAKSVHPSVHLPPSFGRLIELWKQCTGMPISEGRVSNLQESVDEWRKLRNNVVHGMVKSYPDTEPDDITSFIEEAERVAEEGKRLARAVSEWRKKVVNELKGGRILH
jgi:hypothetical protein